LTSYYEPDINNNVGQRKQNNSARDRQMRISVPVKDIVLTSIKFHGTENTRKRAGEIAEECFAKKASVLFWIRKVEKGEIEVN
jgi:hypothetical protein